MKPPPCRRWLFTSTIRECASERDVVRAAISSLNFDPVLFEEIGARPYPPREVYESRLRTSDVFVAVYREEYGWVAPGMTISGIEDELDIAEELAIPRLVYTYKTPAARDQCLVALIERAKQDSGLTIWQYSHPDELRDRLREDITALVSRHFRVGAISSTADADDDKIATRLVPESERFRRPTIERELLSALHAHRVVQIVGEMGVGKTILLATVATDQNWVFVSGRGRTPTELAQRLCARLATELAETTVPRLTYDAATGDAAALLDRIGPRTLAIDDCPSADFVEDLLKGHEERIPNISILFVLRPAGETPFHCFRVPLLVSEEIAVAWKARFGTTPSDAQVAQLGKLSQGIPLYLRYVKSPEEIEVADPTLPVLELKRWRELSSRAQDLVSYVALSDVPTSLEDLLWLTQVEPEATTNVVAAAAEAGSLLVETSAGWLPAHSHLQETLRAHLLTTPVRHSYYATRLAGRLNRLGEHAVAYLVLDRAGSPDAAIWSAKAAARAARDGDLKTLRYVLEKRVAYIEIQADKPILASTLMALAQAADMGGDPLAATTYWQRAEGVAAESAPDLVDQIRLEQLTRNALKSATPQQIADLEALRDKQLASGDRWMAARVAFDLSVIYLHSGRELEAAANARIALREFVEVGDEYGARLAKRNVAAALIGSDDPEGEALLAEISREERPGSLRNRAWLCNVMSRSLRRRGDPKGAQSLAEEAVDIGKRLGDPFVVATNSINAGNCLRDQGLLAEALTAYESAGKEAQRIQARSIDASAAWHAADILNRQGQFDRAIQYADYTIGLTAGTAYEDELSNGYEEKGYALRCLQNRTEAARQYLKAAMAVSTGSDRERRATLLATAARLWYELEDRENYFHEFGTAFGCLGDGPVATELALLPKLADEVSTNHLLNVLGIHFRFIFRNIWDPVARRFFRLAIEKLLGPDRTEVSTSAHVLPLIPLLAAVPGNALTLPLMTEFGDAVHDRLGLVSVRPRDNMAAVYVAKLDVGRRVIMSFEQIDDRPETAAVTALLAMFFLGFQGPLREEIFGGASPVRSDLHLGIIAESEAAELIPQMILSDEEPFGVTRPSSFDGTLPTYVLYRDGLLERSGASDVGRNELLGMLARVLVEVVFQLLRKEVDVGTLMPAIRQIVTRLE